MDNGVLEVTLKQLKEQVDRIAAAVLGDPSDPSKPGHEVRLDRLEQKNKLRDKIFWALISIVGVAVGALLLRYI